MLANPFEKFVRKRFMYHSRDLGEIALNHALLARVGDDDWQRVRTQMRADLEDYYALVGLYIVSSQRSSSPTATRRKPGSFCLLKLKESM